MTPLIDCNVLHSWSDPLEILEYFPAGWREYMIGHMPRNWQNYFLDLGPKPGGRLSSSPMDYDLTYRSPLGDFVEGLEPSGGSAACSSYEELRDEYLNPQNISRALLCHGSGMSVAGLPVPRLTVESAKAINRWTSERWLKRDKRLLGTILAPTQVPELAAEEIRSAGQDPQMVAVLLGANGLSRPFGHPAYLPIFQAANELGLAIVIRAGGDEQLEAATYPTAGGMPLTYTECRALASQSLMTHSASIVCQGIKQRFPNLRFLLLGGSFAWITPFLWRFDADFKAFRQDSLWLKQAPSEVFYENFVVGSGPFMFDAAGSRFAEYMGVDQSLSGVVAFASGYPDIESRGADVVGKALPPGWIEPFRHDNAHRVLSR